MTPKPLTPDQRHEHYQRIIRSQIAKDKALSELSELPSGYPFQSRRETLYSRIRSYDRAIKLSKAALAYRV